MSNDNKILCSLTDDDLKPTEREKQLLQDLFDWQERSRKTPWVLGQPLGYDPESGNKMTEKEIVELLKKNERVYCFLSKEVQEYLREHEEHCQRVDAHGKWVNVLPKRHLMLNDVYRLSEDYELEPEPEYIDLIINNFLDCKRIMLNGRQVPYTDVLHFFPPGGYVLDGFVYEDGKVSLYPIRKPLEDIIWPTAVRYRRK